MKEIKLEIREKLPYVQTLYRFFKKLPFRFGTNEGKFTRIYRSNYWGSAESVSGRGSGMDQAAVIVKELPGIMERIGARSILDIPCGDFNWMKEVDLGSAAYIGADIVAGLVIKNNQLWRSSKRSFLQIDLTTDALPRSDLILCRDCLVHFSFSDIFSALKNIKRSKSSYLLATTFPARKYNSDTLTGQWRTLNLERAPFMFPEPLLLLNENSKEVESSDKSLGLWRIGDIPTELQ